MPCSVLCAVFLFLFGRCDTFCLLAAGCWLLAVGGGRWVGDDVSIASTVRTSREPLRLRPFTASDSSQGREQCLY
jgi:hypothetical protein